MAAEQADGVDRFTQLLGEVDAAFAATSRGLRHWSDPHPDRSPLEEEYSRLFDPGKWRIIGARVDAWIEALVTSGVATAERDVDRDVEVTWVEPPRNDVHRVDRVTARRDGTVPLVVTRNRIEGVDGAGVTIGAGDPAVVVEMIPDCGCDACDSGSQDVIDQVDDCLGGIVRGEFRHLWRRVERPPRPPGFWFAPAPDSAPPIDDVPFDDVPFADTWGLPELETITVLSASRGAHNVTGPRSVDDVLADPTGWIETTGVPWLDR